MCNSLPSKLADFLKTLRNDGQMYAYMIKMKLDMRIGRNCKCEILSMVIENK